MHIRNQHVAAQLAFMTIWPDLGLGKGREITEWRLVPLTVSSSLLATTLDNIVRVRKLFI